MFPGDEPTNLTIIDNFPYAVDVEETVWIPLDKTHRVAARLWRPRIEGAVPAVLEYIPYRRRDGRRADDEQIHPYFAGHGIASIRVDIRGSGDSSGFLDDEYLALEQNDALTIIAWMAAQTWCNGKVGMMGLSWGGFNSLQVAARRPPALKAIIAVGATVDRYNDDVHYKQGCLINENFGWGSSFMSFCSRPPDPAVVGDQWRAIWLERLDRLNCYPAIWLSHPTRDAYWQHGSVCEEYGAIDCPIMSVTGWGDAYVNALPRLLENAGVPVEALAGPWAHQYPHLATPGPAVDFLGAALSWWQRWLSDDIDLEVEDVTYRAFRGEGAPVDGYAAELPGEWLAVDWKRAEFGITERFLTVDGLSTAPSVCPEAVIQSPVDIGMAAGEFIPHCSGPEMPIDQRIDDAGSLLIDSEPLLEPVDLWGEATLQVTLKSDCPTGNMIARLCDVGPDGESQRVTFGVLNLTHREGDDRPVPLPTDKPVTIKIRFDHVCHRFQPGRRIRLALSTAYWPLIWPAPNNPKLTLVPELATLKLPFPVNSRPVQMTPPVAPPAANMALHKPARNERKFITDVAQRRSIVQIEDDYGEVEYLDHGMINHGIKQERMSIDWSDHLSARHELHWTQRLRRGTWQVHSEMEASMWCDAQWFYLDIKIAAFEGEALIWEKRWEERIAR